MVKSKKNTQHNPKDNHYYAGQSQLQEIIQNSTMEDV